MKSVLRLESFCLAVVLGWALSARPARADLGLELLEPPGIYSAFIDVTYNATTDLFNASGFALTLDDDGIGPAFNITGGTFDITATIDASGAFSGGSLAIGGTVSALGFNSGTLLSGDLQALGTPTSGSDPFEFIFDVTGGDASSIFGSIPLGVILSGGTGYNGTFAADFDNLSLEVRGTGTAFSDTAGVIPLPASGWLALCGLGLVTAGRRIGR